MGSSLKEVADLTPDLNALGEVLHMPDLQKKQMQAITVFGMNT